MTSLSPTNLPPDRQRDILRKMLTIRRFEECASDDYTAGRIYGVVHCYIGEEAVAVGVADHIRSTDRCLGAHRSHSHYLALGGDLDQLMAEVLGRATGCSHGFGGSMHLRSPDVGLIGTVPIVGATIPIAVGCALAAKLEGAGDVAVSFLGDGATEEGIFHESVNLAVNQTLVRSINTSVVAALPVAAILFIGAGVLGADTLRDISLALLIGILVGTWSTVFIAAPLYSQMREGEPEIKRHDQKVLKERERAGGSSADSAAAVPAGA